MPPKITQRRCAAASEIHLCRSSKLKLPFFPNASLKVLEEAKSEHLRNYLGKFVSYRNWTSDFPLVLFI